MRKFWSTSIEIKVTGLGRPGGDLLAAFPCLNYQNKDLFTELQDRRPTDNGHKWSQETLNCDKVKSFHHKDLKTVVTQRCSGSSGLVDFQGPTNKAPIWSEFSGDPASSKSLG